MRNSILLGVFVCLSGAVCAGEGLNVGTVAPQLNGTTWISADNKAPVMRNKVLLVDFWFAH